MISYRIKQMNWKVSGDDFDCTSYEQCDVYNISFDLTFYKRDKRYKASYCINEYYDEDCKNFKTFNEATAWLQSILDKYVLDFLDEIITE